MSDTAEVNGTERVAGEATAEPAGPSATALPAALRLGAGVVLAVVAVGVAVLECFYVPLHVGRWPLPISVPAAIVGNFVLARSIARLTGSRHVSLVPPGLWLIVVLVLAAPRPEGDLVVPGNLTGMAFLFLGALAGAFGAASAILPRRPGPGRPGLRRSGLGRPGPGRGGPDRAGLGRAGPGREGAGGAGLGREGLGREGLGGEGLGREGLGGEGVGRGGLGRGGLGGAGPAGRPGPRPWDGA